MTVDFRGHPMIPSAGFSAPTRFGADVCDCEEGAIATVKPPFRLRGGTHTNWFGTHELPPFVGTRAMGTTPFNPERRFLGDMSLSLAGVAAGGLVPVSLLQAAPQCAARTAGASDPCRDWHWIS